MIDKSDPMNEPPKPEWPYPEWPKPEFPKSKPPKPALLKRDPPKFEIERPGENDENEENRDPRRTSDEKRFAPNPTRGSRAENELPRFRPNDDPPETFEAKFSFLVLAALR